MQKYLMVLCLLLVGAVTLMFGLYLIYDSPTVSTAASDSDTIVADELWCDEMLEKPNAKWTDEETRLFGKNCI